MIPLDSHTVPPHTLRTRFSEYAIGLFTAIPSRNAVKKAIKKGELLLDGEPAHTGDWVQPGQLIERIAIAEHPPKVYEFPLEVVYEDEEIAVIIKPGGLPTNGNFHRTAEHAAPFNLKPSTAEDALPWPLPAHRLDRATHGLLVFAKTRSARVTLGEMFAERDMEKRYQAVVMGKIPESGLLDSPIKGKEALTRYERVRVVRSLKCEWLSLVNLWPLTGRTHQLRIHLSEAGYPILGDQLHHNNGPLLKGKGLFLCAADLSFVHPLTEEELAFKIDPPAKFKIHLDRAQTRWDKFHSPKP